MGLPLSVISNRAEILFTMASDSAVEEDAMSISSTLVVMYEHSELTFRTYTLQSDSVRLNPIVASFALSSLYYCLPDCFNPYSPFLNLQ